MTDSTTSEVTKLMISIPCFGGLIQASTAHSVMKTTHELIRMGLDFQLDFELHESLVQRARNSLTHRFLKSDCSHQLFIDADVVFDPVAVIGLLGAGKDVVGGAYPRKALITQQIIDAVQRGERNPLDFAADFVVNVLPAKDGETEVTLTADNGCVPVMEAPTGFLLVSRDAYIRLIAAHPEWLYYSDASANRGEAMHAIWACEIFEGRLLSEDWLFSRRWQALGETVWLFLPAQLGHIGTHTYRGNLFQTFQPIDGPAFERELSSEYSLPEDNPPEHAKLMTERYTWAAARVKGRMIADAACGPGYGLPILARGGAEVKGFDRAQENADTARTRDFGLVWVGDVTGLDFEGYDAVVSIETIEHLPDPIAWMRGFAPSVKELVVSCPCIPTKHVNEHHLHDFTYDEVLGILRGLGWTVVEHAKQNDDVIMVYAVRP